MSIFTLVFVYSVGYNIGNLEKEYTNMGLHYKTDILAALKARGYNTTRLRKEHLLSESTIQKLRDRNGVSWTNVETLCRLLGCQPGDILAYTEGD